MIFRRRHSQDASGTEELRKARRAAARGEVDGVVSRCKAAIEAFDRVGPQAAGDELARTLDQYVDLCEAAGRPDLSLAVLERLAAFDPDELDLALDIAIFRFELGAFDEAEQDLLALRRECDPHPDLEWYLGACAERRGDWERADRQFAAAHKLDPRQYPRPLRVTDRHNEALVDKVLQTLPDNTYDVIERVPIYTDPIPPLGLLQLTEPPFSPFILGLHHGMDLRHDSVFHPGMYVDGIRVFPRNIAKIAWSLRQYDEEFETTLLHEIGHRLGLDEEELWDRGL